MEEIKEKRLFVLTRINNSDKRRRDEKKVATEKEEANRR